MNTSEPGSPLIQADRAAALCIAAGALLSCALMALHPTIESHGAAGFVAEATREATVNASVHVALAVAALVVLAGYGALAAQPGMRRTAARIALTFQAAGTLLLVAAAVTSGVITPSFAARYADADAAELAAMVPVLHLAGAAVHACARVGIVLLSLAFVSWSLPLLRAHARGRGTGLVGMVAGLLPLLAVGSGHLTMSVHGFGGVVLVQTAWHLAVAGLLLRAGARPPSRP